MRWLLVFLAIGCSNKKSEPVVAVVPEAAPPACHAKRTHVEGSIPKELPDHAIARLGDTHLRHGSPIQHIMFCGGAVIASDRGFVTAWDPKTGERRAKWQVGNEDVVRLQCIGGVPHAVTSTGHEAALDLATGALDVLELGELSDAVAVTRDDIRIVRAESVGRALCDDIKQTAPIDRSLFPARISRTGQLAGAVDAKLFMYGDPTKPPRELPTRDSPIEQLEWSTDGSRLLAAYKNHIVDVFALDGARVRTFGPFAEGVENNVEAIAANADMIAIGTYGGELLRFNANTGAALPALQVERDQMTGSVNALAFSDDGSQLAIGGGDQFVHLLPVLGNQIVVDRAHGHQENLWMAVFSPDGARIATVSSDATMRVWDAATGAQLAALSDDDGRPKISVTWSGGTIVAADDYGNLRRWDASSFVPAEVVKSPGGMFVYELAASTDRATFALASNTDWWILDSQTLTQQAHGKLTAMKDALQAESLTFDRKGQRFALCRAQDHTLVQVLTSSGAPVFTRTIEGDTCPSLALSPDGTKLAIDHELVTIGGATISFTSDQVGALRFSDDGKLLAGVAKDEIRIWDVATHKLVRTFRGHDGTITSIAWSPTGDRIVTTSDDLDALVWRL